MIKTSDAIFDILKQHVDIVFLVPGGGAMHLVDSLGKSGLNYVAALHEQGAAFMAVGYAQFRKSLGVCLVTSGPGATNAITGCAAAWMDSVPVLFISGQALSTTLVGNTGLRTRGVQEVDIIPMIAPITKFCWRMRLGGENIEILKNVIKLCLVARPGPCWLEIPLDIQAEEI